MTEATATPEGAPVSEAASIEAVMAQLDAEQDAETQPETPQADESEAGDAEQAPEPDDEAEPADDAPKAEDAAEPEPTLPTTVKVKVNGAELEVPLDEALKGYSRTEDYKAKTAALAEEGRTLRTQYATQLQTIASQFEAFDPILAQARNVNWVELARTDPAGKVLLETEVQERLRTLQSARAEIERIEAETSRETRQREYDALVSAMPQLADPDAAAKYDTELRTYLKSSLKFDDATINSVDDHRFYLLAEKARQFDAIQAAKASLPAKIVKPARTVPTVKPGNAEPSRSSPRKPSASAPMREQLAWLARNV